MDKKQNQVVLVDKKGKVIGVKEKNLAHQNPAPLHQAVSVLIFDEAPTGSHPGYLLPALRREQNPSEAKNSSLSSPSLRSRFFAKGDENKILIQKRSKFKKTWPLTWSNTCCSHPYPGETFQKAAERRLKEEIGVTASLKRKFKLIYQAKYNSVWGENEYDWVFVGHYQGKLNSDPKEVAELKWVELWELKKDIQKKPKDFTPWFKLILERI